MPAERAQWAVTRSREAPPSTHATEGGAMFPYGKAGGGRGVVEPVK